jgi:hypothetical protein
MLKNFTRSKKLLIFALIIAVPLLSFTFAIAIHQNNKRLQEPKSTNENNVPTAIATIVPTSTIITPTITPTPSSGPYIPFNKFTVTYAKADSSWSNYSSKACKVNLSYPPAKAPYTKPDMSKGFENWKVFETTEKTPDYLKLKNKTSVYAPIPFGISAETTEGIEIYALKLSCVNEGKALTLDQYLEKMKNLAKNNQGKYAIVNVEKREELEIFGQKAYMVKYQTLDEEGSEGKLVDNRFDEIIFTKGTYLYHLELGLETSDQEVNSILNKILNSIVLT